MQVVFIGPPGAGKGTQCQLLVEYLQAVHISTGQLLRDAIEADTKQGREAKTYIKQGQLAPDGLVLDMIRSKLRELDVENGVLFDGFPRTVTQAQGLDEILAENARPLDAALELQVPDDEIVKRLSGRGRDDDSQETVRTRLGVFNRQTAPVLCYYRERGLLHVIDGMGTSDDVFARIRACIDACEQKTG